jgi:protoporphyrinogen/coproporphyrinogen III oxidase
LGQGVARRAVVIGGGLAGLSAAARLADGGWRVHVLEKESQVGGRCGTVRSAGFLFDTGAQHFHDSYDDTLNLAIRNGLGDRFRIPAEPKGVFHDGRVRQFIPRDTNPLSLLPWSAMGPSGLFDTITVGASLLRGYRGYNMRFPYWWDRGDDVPAGKYLAHRTSASYRRSLAEPVSLYCWGVGPEKISAAAMNVAMRYTFLDRTGGFTVGMGGLCEALAGKVEVSTGMEATEVVTDAGLAVGVKARPSGGGRSRSYKGDAVICAIPAPQVDSVAGAIGRTAHRVIEATEFVPAIVVNMGFRGTYEGTGGPFLLPLSEGFTAAWLCAGSSKAAEYAPEGGVVITAVFCDTRAEELVGDADEVITEIALADTSRALSAGRLELKASHVQRHRLARPVVGPGHAKRVKELRLEGSGLGNLMLAGDWTMTPTVEGAVSSGLFAAERALALAAGQQ